MKCLKDDQNIKLHYFQQKIGQCHVTLLYIVEIMMLIYLYLTIALEVSRLT